MAAVAASAVLSVLSIAAAVRSYRTFDDIALVSPRRAINLCSFRGKFYFQNATASGDLWTAGKSWYSPAAASVGYHWAETRYRVELLGLATELYRNRFGDVRTSERIIVLPWWFIATLTATPPALAARRLRQRRRRTARVRAGLCGRCGYDLRASEERCPECGELPTAG